MSLSPEPKPRLFIECRSKVATRPDTGVRGCSVSAVPLLNSLFVVVVRNTVGGNNKLGGGLFFALARCPCSVVFRIASISSNNALFCFFSCVISECTSLLSFKTAVRGRVGLGFEAVVTFSSCSISVRNCLLILRSSASDAVRSSILHSLSASLE